jgi:hypothetical protein
VTLQLLDTVSRFPRAANAIRARIARESENFRGAAKAGAGSTFYWITSVINSSMITNNGHDRAFLQYSL